MPDYERITHETALYDAQQPQGLTITCHYSSGYYESVRFLLLRERNVPFGDGQSGDGYCWLLLDDSHVPQRHGQFHCRLEDCIKLAQGAARRWLRYIAERQEARDRAETVADLERSRSMTTAAF